MRSPEQVIVQTIRFDHDPTGNAQRIVGALSAEGYEITVSDAARMACRYLDLPETGRVFAGD